jgi:hypothetical protein
MKKLILTSMLACMALPTFAAIRELDPTKVLVDDVTGTVIFVPRDNDYKAQMDVLKENHTFEITKLTVETESTISIQDQQDNNKSLFEKIFGRKSGKKCHRRG